MSEIITILFFLCLIGGFVGIAALWTQRDINKRVGNNESDVHSNPGSSLEK